MHLSSSARPQDAHVEEANPSLKMRIPRARIVFAAMAVATVVFNAFPGGAAPVDPCDARTVTGIGRACSVPGGMRVLLPDGGSVLTHGHDPLPLQQAMSLPSPVKPDCVTDPRTQPHGVLVYAHASDQPNFYGSKVTDLRTMAATANALLRQEANDAASGRTVSYRMLCDGPANNKILVVNDAPMLTRLADTTFETVVAGLRALGMTNPLAKYWVFFDGHPPGTKGGTGTLEYDDRLAADNRNNFGPSYGVVWGYGLSQNGAVLLMHENAHSLGAVQLSAAHTTDAGHCTDGQDVMCYPDGGARSNQFNANVCATLRFDCRHDDYFHPDPSSQNYLSRRWNIASPYNRFVSGCQYTVGIMPAGAAGTEADGVTMRQHAIDGDCVGRNWAVSGWVLQPPAGALPYTSSISAIGVDVSVCFYEGGTKLSCPSADRGTVPAGTTAARVIMQTGAAAGYVLSLI